MSIGCEIKKHDEGGLFFDSTDNMKQCSKEKGIVLGKKVARATGR